MPLASAGRVTVIVESFGKVFNATGEVVAEGECEVNLDRGSVTLRTVIDAPLLLEERSMMRLELEDGSEYALRGTAIRFRLNTPGALPGPAYRLFLVAGQQRSD